MKIQNLSFCALRLPQTKPAYLTNTDYKNNYSYNPISYRDFNINFTARLFRTPENFYAQPFNKNGMPDTMKQYLNADFEDRQKMPPAQMLRLVFDDIKETKNLEQVKRIFPNEQLFKDLTDIPNRKARTGIIAEIDLMREDGKTLFKNGNDNLGHYILKKIYTESKTLKEINTDFKKDVSVHYNGLSPIGYDTLHAYGIKFPDNSFWKSLTATREEFPYEYKPRKPIETRVSASHIQQPKVYAPRRKRFENVKDWEIDKIKKALIEGNGNETETRKRLKKTNLRDEASLNFVAKYMGEINSVVLEKLNISPEMHYFFENYEQLNKSQTQKFTEYMQQKDVNELRSIIMSDIIKLFFDAYGVDGQNEEFQELLAYARNIKPEREKALREHNRIQAEYDEMFANIPEDTFAENKTEEQTVQKSESMSERIDKFEQKLQEITKDNNAQIFKFNLSDGTVWTVSVNLEESVNGKLETEFLFYPKKFVDDFTKFVMKKEGSNTKYLLSLAFDEIANNTTLTTENLNDEEKINLYNMFKEEHLMSHKELLKKNSEILEEFISKHRENDNALGLAFAAEIFNLPLDADNIRNIIDKTFIKEKMNKDNNRSDEEIFTEIYKQVREIIKRTSNYGVIGKQTKTLNEALKFYVTEDNFNEMKERIMKRYQLYKQPLTSQEIRQLPAKIVEGCLYYNQNKSGIGNDEYKNIINAICESVQQDKNFRSYLINLIRSSQTLKMFLADRKIYFDESISKDLLAAQTEYVIMQLLMSKNIVPILTRLTPQALEKIKFTCPELYITLRRYKNL